MHKFFYNIYKNSSNGKIKYRIMGDGRWIIYGYSDHYESKYLPELKSLIDEKNFIIIMSDLNDICYTYYPCYPIIIISLLLSVFTFGLSLLLPWY